VLDGYALIGPGQHLSEAVHLLFAGEKPKSIYPVANPELRPELKNLFGLSVPVAPLQDLVTLKLNSLRPEDVVDLEVLDNVGFITPTLEAHWPDELQNRL
jgi:hypothetical protein